MISLRGRKQNEAQKDELLDHLTQLLSSHWSRESELTSRSGGRSLLACRRVSCHSRAHVDGHRRDYDREYQRGHQNSSCWSGRSPRLTFHSKSRTRCLQTWIAGANSGETVYKGDWEVVATTVCLLACTRGHSMDALGSHSLQYSKYSLQVHTLLAQSAYRHQNRVYHFPPSNRLRYRLTTLQAHQKAILCLQRIMKS